ncbi:3'-5' exonuclease [Sphingomonas sp. 2378]|uniref:3'-5' exonuclease n=1 Tax=Sphingomonas sp. 2378 TaxID=1219748 RepID=UPI00311AE931
MTWGIEKTHFGVTDTLAFVDVETTGLSANYHDIIELAVLLIVPGQKRHHAISHLVRPPNGIPPKITALTGITNAMVERDGIELDDAAHRLREAVHPHPIVAFNAAFDISFLDAACHKTYPRSERSGHACALKLSRLAWPGLASYKLSNLANFLGLPPSTEHRALGDAKRCAHVYYRALGARTTET